MKKVVKKEYVPAKLPYTPISSVNFIKQDNSREIEKRILKTIRDEAPITDKLVKKRVINSFDIMKAGKHVDAKMELVLAGMDLNCVKDKSTRIYWRNDQKPKKYAEYRIHKNEETKRDVTWIASEEVANAVIAILEKEGVLPYEQLARKTALVFDYTRMGSNVTKAMKKGISKALNDKEITTTSSGYTLANH